MHRNLIEYKSTTYFNHDQTKLRQKLFAFLYTCMPYHSTGITYLHRMHDISQISQVVVYFLRFQCFPIFITINIFNRSMQALWSENPLIINRLCKKVVRFNQLSKKCVFIISAKVLLVQKNICLINGSCYMSFVVRKLLFLASDQERLHYCCTGKAFKRVIKALRNFF